MDLNALKKALEDGLVFTGADKLNEIQKKADGIGDLTGKERSDIFDERKERAKEGWKNIDEDNIKELIAEESKKMEMREEASKNEMELAEIKFIENEINIIEEYISNLLEEVNDKKRQIDNHQIRIDEIKKNIE